VEKPVCFTSLWRTKKQHTTMTIGVAFYGDVQTVDGQGISTQFFILGVPLVPLKSMFVIEDRGTEKRGFEIDIHGQSTLLGYARILTFILGFLFVLLGWLLPRECGGLLIPGIVFLAAWVFVQFFTGKPSEQDAAKRRMIGKALGVNAFPEWLPREVVQGSITLLEEKYNSLYQSGLVQHANWKDFIKTGQTMNSAFMHIIYTLALFNHCLFPGADANQLLERAGAKAGL
jgi:hypothetical protein